LRIHGVPGRSYIFEYASEITGPWNSLTAPIPAGQSGVISLDDPATPAAILSRFYRGRQAPDLPAGLVSWWRAQGDGLDSAGSNHGIPLNGLRFAPGRPGRQAFHFDGGGGFLLIGGAPIPVPWTAGFWIKRQESPDPSAVLLRDDATALKLEQWEGARVVGFTRFGVADYMFNYVAPVEVWVHLVFVGTSTATRLFVNGSMVDWHPASISLPLGRLGGDTLNYLKGLVDEITVFDRALSQAEVTELYNSTL
jgi:hypothetical protein